MQLVYNTVLLGKIYAIKYLETTLTSMKIATIKTMTMTAFVIGKQMAAGDNAGKTRIGIGTEPSTDVDKSFQAIWSFSYF